jgi:hypothetical protein
MISRLVVISLLTSLLVLAAGCEKEGPAERAGEKLDNAVSEGQDKVGDAVDRVGEKLEKAGKSIQETTQQ